MYWVLWPLINLPPPTRPLAYVSDPPGFRNWARACTDLLSFRPQVPREDKAPSAPLI